jgi:hypothetical protein
VRPRFRLVVTSLIALGLAFAFAAGSSPQQPDVHESADLRLFDPGNIIDDDIFYNAGAMDAAAVQAFLATKGSECTSSLCLKNLRQDTWTRAADQYCASYPGRSGDGGSDHRQGQPRLRCQPAGPPGAAAEGTGPRQDLGSDGGEAPQGGGLRLPGHRPL